MLASYHVHTRWSDGGWGVADYVRAARAMGLDEIGISDHYVLIPDGGQVRWSMMLDALEGYVDAVQSAACEAGENLVVRLGIEADYFPETADVLKDVLASHPFDYVIGAVHILDGFPIDESAENWERLTQGDRDDVIRRYWIRLREMAESRMFDIAAHLDLTKKFGFKASVDLSDEISSALDAIASADMSVEVNTAGWYFACEEAYPAPSIIRQCLDRGIPVLIAADAHDPPDVIRGFDRARQLLQDMGCTHIASYAGRRRFMHPLTTD
ncbi:MAG TPA: histidinol-phosphatase HisJ family protein [Armatimonadota bacterium]|nr:histidinol-phosphatase HisJ family protein [Armatimonadota bacterium]